MAYSKQVLDHYERPRNVGSLDKNGLQDLQKAKHYIDMLIELEEK